MSKHTITDLHQMQSLPLSAKIQMTALRITEWVDRFGEEGVYVSFSGGKDSTVLVDIVRNVCNYKDIPLAFVEFDFYVTSILLQQVFQQTSRFFGENK